MNLVLFTASELDKDNLLLTDYRAQHILSVLKLKPGDNLRVGQIEGLVGVAKVIGTEKSSVLLKVELTKEPPPPSPVKIILALPRPKVLGRKLRSLTELGVKEIHLINAAKVESSYWTAHQLSEENIHQHFLAGLSQSYDTVLPKLYLHRGFRPFAEDHLPRLTKDHHTWVAHPYAEERIVAMPEKSFVAIGPEGGWVDFELECFKKANFREGHLGQRVMSTETAIVSLVSQFFSQN